MSIRLCDYCESIPWTDLPSEIDPGVPHQPSLQALKISSGSCSLCSLILQAAFQVRERVDGKHRARSFGGWTSFSGHDLSDGRTLQVTASSGVYGRGSDGSTGIYEPKDETWRTRPAYEFLNDTEARAWLYGGWWYSEPHKEKLQLLGLGVRIGKSADLASGEGNGKSKTSKRADGTDHEIVECALHGTQLRLSTDHGD
jgi:hypothetical protein